MNPASRRPGVVAIILNYRNWPDTLRCLESVYRLDYPRLRVIVVENGSDDDSLDRIRAWAAGEQPAPDVAAHPLRAHLDPPVPKPLSVAVVPAGAAEAPDDGRDLRRLLTIVRSDENRGFSGGNNLGIRLAAARANWGYLWLLNNDTVVPPDALDALVRTAEGDPGLGLVGSRLLDMTPPHAVQALGGRIQPLTGASRHLRDERELPTLNYIVGASMLISRACLERVSPLDEDFFLYAEDSDYSLRVRRKGLRIGVALDSRVYHTEGGTSAGPAQDYYGIRNSLYLNRRHFPGRWPVTGMWIALRIAKRLAPGRWTGLRAALQGWRDYRAGRMGKRT